MVPASQAFSSEESLLDDMLSIRLVVKQLRIVPDACVHDRLYAPLTGFAVQVPYHALLDTINETLEVFSIVLAMLFRDPSPWGKATVIGCQYIIVGRR